jgi:hypothetical protein
MRGAVRSECLWTKRRWYAGASCGISGAGRYVDEFGRSAQRNCQVVELRFFGGGMSVEETAEVLGVSPITVKRDWSTTRPARLHKKARRGVRDGASDVRRVTIYATVTTND